MLALPVIGLILRFQRATQQKIANLRVWTLGSQHFRIPLGDHRFSVGIKEYRVVSDRKYARELMRQDDDGGAETGAQREDQSLEQVRADRVKACRWGTE